MDFTTVCWIISIALALAICVMAVSLVSGVMTIIEQYQKISGRQARE